jgi:hypothetical protein
VKTGFDSLLPENFHMDIREFSFTGSYIKRIEKSVLELGFQEGLRREIKRSNSKFLVFGKEEIRDILAEAPVIIVFNHPHEVETLACLAALPDREDVFMVATYLLMGLMPAIDKHLIPVYVRQRDVIPRKISAFILEHFAGKGGITLEEKHQRNIQSIRDAAEKVRQGGLVMISPNPDNKKWHAGIGWMINNAGSMEQAYYIKVHVFHSSLIDYLRLIPGLGRILPTIKIYFSAPVKLSRIWQTDGKKLTLELEEEYNEWVKGLNK